MRLTKQIMSAVVLTSLCGMLFLGLTNHPNDPPCVPKPYPVTMDIYKLPPELQPVFQQFVDDMNYRIIDEIYLRFCSYILDSIYEATACSLNVDSIFQCLSDTLYTFFDAIAVKTVGDDVGGAGLLLYEDSTTSQYDTNTVNRQFFVSLEVSSDDTNNVRENVRHILPGRYASQTDGGNLGTSLHDTSLGGQNMAPNYAFINRLSNSYLVGDGRGHLMWQDRDDYTRLQVDTIIADTGAGQGDILIETEFLTLKADSQRAISGLWSGNLGPRIHHYSDDFYIGFWPKVTLKQNWNWVWPDTQSIYEGGYLRQVDGASASPKWAPYDDEFIIRGVDTIPCDETSTVINPLRDGFRPAGRNFHNRYDTFRTYQVYLQWVRFDKDTAMGTHGSDGVYGCPDPVTDGGRWNDLWVETTFDPDFLPTGDPRQTTDSTFTIHTPAFGCIGTADIDSTKIVQWMCVGRISGWDGEG